MALTPQNNEAFLREVDEEYRRDQMLSAWRRYGRWIIVAVVVALALLAGVLFWQHRARVAADKDGEALQAAYDALSSGDNAAAQQPLAALEASKGDGYRVLAAFTQADILLQKDDLRGAAAKFGAVASDTSVAQPFRDLALVRQTSAEFDTLKPDVVVQRLSGLAVPGNPWFGSAGELVAVAYIKQGKRAQAGQMFARIAADDNVPQSLRQRVVQMAGAMGVDAKLPQAAGAQTGKGKAE